MKKKIVALALSLTFGLSLSACGGQGQVEEQVSSVPEVVEEEPEVEEIKLPRSLLTNEESDTDRSKVRPIAVMIENTRDALPHYGLANAGIIYESVVEGGITRYMALFDDYEDFERLGNVRSARPYYIYLASEYDAIFISHGQSEEGLNILNSGVVDNYNGMYDMDGFFRATDKKMPHNSYLESEGLLVGLEKKGIETSYTEDYTGHFYFAEDENLLNGGDAAEYIKLYYSTNKPSFVYDKDKKTYKRYAFGDVEPDVYSEDGIEVSNIIFQNVDAWVEDSVGHVGMTLVTTGEGKFFTRGKVVDIKWKKDSNTGKTFYYMPDGSEIELNTGKTFIALIENSRKDDNEILEKYE